MKSLLMLWIGGALATFSDLLFQHDARRPLRSLLVAMVWPLRIMVIGYDLIELARFNRLIYGTWRRGRLR